MFNKVDFVKESKGLTLLSMQLEPAVVHGHLEGEKSATGNYEVVVVDSAECVKLTNEIGMKSLVEAVRRFQAIEIDDLVLDKVEIKEVDGVSVFSVNCYSEKLHSFRNVLGLPVVGFELSFEVSKQSKGRKKENAKSDI